MVDVAEITQILSTLPCGKIYGFNTKKEDARRAGRRLLVRRIAAGYEIEAAWVVPASYDEDPESHTNNPFGIGTSFELVACERATAADAAAAYATACDQLKSRQPVRW